MHPPGSRRSDPHRLRSIASRARARGGATACRRTPTDCPDGGRPLRDPRRLPEVRAVACGGTHERPRDRGAPAIGHRPQAAPAGGQHTAAHGHRGRRGPRRSIAHRREPPHAARRREPPVEEAALGRAAPPAGDAVIVPRLRGAGCGAPRSIGGVRTDRAAGRRTRPGARDRTGAPAPRHGRRGPCSGVPRRRRSGSARDTR